MGLLFILIKGNWANFVGSDLFELDLLTIIIAYFLLYYGQTAAATFAFGQGLLIDIFSGGLHGLFTFLYLGVVGAIYLGSRFFNLQDPQGQGLMICLAVLSKKLLLVIVLSGFSTESFFSRSFILMSLASALGTGLIAPLVFYLFTRLWGITKDAHEASTEEL
ncbi:MAG: rod shape-determining protein MreD [Desulfobacteraceae bacterium]|nr:rod shape-determining protein MreD [Desulfobacteraceae bacterium]